MIPFYLAASTFWLRQELEKLDNKAQVFYKVIDDQEDRVFLQE